MFVMKKVPEEIFELQKFYDEQMNLTKQKIGV